ncbi:MAG: carboxymuconolactone decarboxylase family protein [Nitrospinaceae bacterium]|nr:carboxymuconolactone decarboxylase family protein [Nitrospinaceae bacterium]MBT3434629.1 carboxymuconolactone decarboxylase family protein [Nitrospinaceae bacterium]MBT3821746.1 carboxymuconolactone decarboxylase family protein [Nitrospinaceae bacterium]MBT4093762.1 carboxymuconolactone decarboxylase family protein [Nitrospinaceae bacterium]MBT4428945.1 carboxymuconolactone decarboxylase family protein [Nitrospinaceae bacterium]
MERSELYEKGAAIRRQMVGDNPMMEERLSMIENLDPEMLRYINEFSYGTIYARPRFSVKQRQLLALMANIVLDRAEVRPHIRNALNLGWEKEDVMEVIATSVVYGGFPVAASALKLADEVFREWDAEQEEGQAD